MLQTGHVGDGFLNRRCLSCDFKKKKSPYTTDKNGSKKDTKVDKGLPLVNSQTDDEVVRR